jgi:hypothetical protein
LTENHGSFFSWFAADPEAKGLTVEQVDHIGETIKDRDLAQPAELLSGQPACPKGKTRKKEEEKEEEAGARCKHASKQEWMSECPE